MAAREERKDSGEPQAWSAVPRRRASDWLMFKLRLPVIIATAVCSVAFLEPAQATASPLVKKANASRKLGLSIRVEGSGWGSAKKEKIETVLYAVADELMSRLPKKLMAPIIVTHTDKNPIALYQRGPQGEYLVRLHASGEDWQFYVYEFAHELCHILSNYEENLGADTSKYNQWFEETLCETASLYTLKSLAATWENAPSSSEWRGQAVKLRRFFDLLINEGHRRLPPHSPLATWLQDNEENLRRNPYLRDKNEVVANLLLPLFSSSPENWDALTYLNLSPGDARASLQDYLDNWYRNAPAGHKLFIGRILSLLRGASDAPAAGNTMVAAQKEPSPANTGALGAEGEDPPAKDPPARSRPP